MFSIITCLPFFVAAILGLPDLVGLAAWLATLAVGIALGATAPSTAQRLAMPRRSSSYEPAGLGAYYAYQDWASGGDCGGDGGAC
jgi:hypothetical protein